MAFPAARLGDTHVCPAHGGGPVEPPPVNVETNHCPQARASDPAFCLGGPCDYLVTGAATVTVNSKPAGRLTSKTMHRGTMAFGAPSVLIGGPSAGVVLGDPDAATEKCKALAATRHTPGRAAQSYGNCGLECWRSVINRARAARGLPPLTEDEVQQRALELGVSPPYDPAHPGEFGKSDYNGRIKLLADQGVPAEVVLATGDNAAQAVADGRGVSATVHPVHYWPPGSVGRSTIHEILVTGVEYDENGEVKAFIVNDTGIGACGLVVPADKFNRALLQPGGLTVTRDHV